MAGKWAENTEKWRCPIRPWTVRKDTLKEMTVYKYEREKKKVYAPKLCTGTCRQEYQQWACLELYLFCPAEQGGCGGDIKILCSHLINAIMDQHMRYVCVSVWTFCVMMFSFGQIISWPGILPLTNMGKSSPLWALLSQCLFLDMKFFCTLEASVVFVVSVSWSSREWHFQTNQQKPSSVKKFSADARAIYFIIYRLYCLHILLHHKWGGWDRDWLFS